MLTTAELRSAGLSAGQIGRLVGKGALCPLSTGVYASAAAAAAVDRRPAGHDDPANR